VMIYTLPSRFSCNMWILYDPLWTNSSWMHLGRIDVMWSIWAYMSIAYISLANISTVGSQNEES
jgi:hypothetical protein